MSEKEDEEEFYFKQFAKVCPITLGAPRRSDTEGASDFLVQVGDKTVGIELTEYLIQRSQKKLAFREKIIESAEKRYQELSANSTHTLTGSIYVHMNRDIGVVMKKETLRPGDIAERLAQFVDAFKEENGTDDPYLHYLLLKEYGLEQFFKKITIHHEPRLPLLIWHNHNHAYRASDLSHDSTIQGIKNFIAQKKEVKVSTYLKYCDVCWLLVVGSVGGSASPVRIRKEDVSETEKLYQGVFNDSLFEKIFFFDSRWIVNLK